MHKKRESYRFWFCLPRIFVFLLLISLIVSLQAAAQTSSMGPEDTTLTDLPQIPTTGSPYGQQTVGPTPGASPDQQGRIYIEPTLPEPTPPPDRGVSIIEQAYRLQYSEVLLRQLQAFDEKAKNRLDLGRREELGQLQKLESQHLATLGARQALENDYLAALTRLQSREMERSQYDKLVELQRETVDSLTRQIAVERQRQRGDGGSTADPAAPMSPQTNLNMPGRPDMLDLPSGPRREELKSEVPRILDKFDQPSLTLVDEQLTQFGYDLFFSKPLEYFPTAGASVPENYILGPGDVLRINVWGTGVDTQFQGKIMADGNITFPKIGVMNLSGVVYQDVRSLVERELSKVIQGVQVNIAVARPRNLEIYVVGQVARPGLTLVPAFSTVLGALTRAGGPLKTGSMRQVHIYRGGQIYRTLDLYDLIFRGSIRDDVFLRDKDVIHVPYIGPTVAVVGAVQRPGIFEMTRSKVSIGQALNVAGGAVSQAMARVYIRRFVNNRTLTIKDVDITAIQSGNITVQSGDLLEVRFIGHQFPNAIRVTGHVWDETEHNYYKGILASKVVPRPEQLRPEAVTEFCLLKRYDAQKADYNWHRIPLSKVWAGVYDMELLPHDMIRILSREEYGINRKVHLRGAVWRQADYDWSDGMTVRDLIAMAGGLKDGANLCAVEISRQKIVNFETLTEHFRINLTDQNNNCPLAPYDTVMVPFVKGTGEVRQVSVEGEVRFPGRYTLKRGERFSDLIARAGGFLPTAYLYGIDYRSKSAQKIQQESINRMVHEIELRLTSAAVAFTSQKKEAAEFSQQLSIIQESFLARLKALKATGRVNIMIADLESFRGSRFDFELDDGDTIQVPRKPNFINVVGNVYAPNSYLYRPEVNVGDYIRMAGGPTKTADEGYIYVQKANGQVISVSQTGFFRDFYKQHLMPGDTIIVPDNLERMPTWELAKDLTDILYKIALTTGVVVNLWD